MDVTTTQDGHELQVATENLADIEKIRGLGYIGLLTYGAHHQQHHWMIATGEKERGRMGERACGRGEDCALATRNVEPST